MHGFDGTRDELIGVVKHAVEVEEKAVQGFWRHRCHFNGA
jgi:hypothetical protein